MELSLRQIADVLEARILGDQTRIARGYSIDSRTIQAGELFFAVQGARLDGHEFVLDALGRGAVAAVVAESRVGSYPADVRERLIAVRETLAAFQRLGQAVRERWGGPVVAVTGSTGKTTTKEITAALLGTRYRVAKSEGNLNNAFGLPLSLLRLEPGHDLAVVELGMSQKGEIARLAEIARPDLGVVTCVAPVHLEFFSSVEEIAAAKYELIEALRGSDHTAILNADDLRVARFAEGFSGRVVRFGIEHDAEVQATNIEHRGALGSSFDLNIRGARGRVELPLMGLHNVRNALAAVAVATRFSLGLAETRAVFPSLVPAAMRGELVRFAAGFAVINDCYNSNPVALESMIATLMRTPGYRRRVLAAGEMRELGPTSRELHRRCGEQAARAGIDIVIGVEGDASEIAAGAQAAGLPADRARFFPDKPAATEFLTKLLASGDLVLLKGSRAVALESILENLRARYDLASGQHFAQARH